MGSVVRPHQTSRENSDYVSDYFAASRLHFIGSWKSRFVALLDALPPAPPRPVRSDRVIAHIDMDAFFASVAVRGHPELQGLPVAVSWSDNAKGAGEIASANYQARAHGVRNGMGVATAKEKCADIILMPYTFEAYAETAECMYRLVFETTPFVLGVSCDECFADLTDTDDPDAAANSLRASIRAATRCNASIGLGPNRLVARLATRRAKPDGQVRLTAAEGRAMLEDEEVGSLPEVGPSLTAKLRDLGIITCGELGRASSSRLREKIGPRKAAVIA